MERNRSRRFRRSGHLFQREKEQGRGDEKQRAVRSFEKTSDHDKDEQRAPITSNIHMTSQEQYQPVLIPSMPSGSSRGGAGARRNGWRASHNEITVFGSY